MTITTWPIDAVAAVPGRQLREAQSVYLPGASAADPFGVTSGVRPGTSATTVTATSTTWTVGAHAGALDLQSAVEASGYAYAVNATGGLPTGAMTAADATRPRVDIVWVRSDDPSEGDGSAAPTVVFGYTAGAPLASPVAPATPARCMVLATIQVPMSGGGSPTVIWTAPYTVAAGGVLPVSGASAYPAAPYVGQVVDDAAMGGQWRYNGTAWFPISGAMPGGRVIRDGTAFTIPANVWQPLSSFWVVDQPALGVTFTSGVWTVTTPGVYDVECACHISTAAITFELIVKLNDLTVGAAGTRLAASAVTTAVGGAASVKGRLRLNAGDTLLPAVYASGSCNWSNTAAQSEARASFFGLRYVEPLR